MRKFGTTFPIVATFNSRVLVIFDLTYLRYYAWCSLDHLCNPSFSEIAHGPSNSTSGNPGDMDAATGIDGKSIVSLIVFLACVLYARYANQFIGY